MGTIVRQHDLTDEIRAFCRLESIEYADVFTASLRDGASTSPEDWARAIVEDAAGARGQFVWRVVLQFRMQSGSAAKHIGGWDIAERTEDRIRLHTMSWFAEAEAIVHVHDGLVSLATLVRHRNPVASLAVPPVMAFHRRAVPGLLRSAARSSRVRP